MNTQLQLYMNLNTLNKFRDLLIENKKSVSKLEYTKNNYNNDGNLIKEGLPTWFTTILLMQVNVKRYCYFA